MRADGYAQTVALVNATKWAVLLYRNIWELDATGRVCFRLLLSAPSAKPSLSLPGTVMGWRFKCWD